MTSADGGTYNTLARESSYNINNIANEIHQTAVDHGFWDKERNLGEMLMLATSELAEALEADREGQPTVWFKHARICPWGDDWQHSDPKPDGCCCDPKPEGALVEIIDAIIRELDTAQHLAGRTRYTVYEVMRLKMDYNHTRAHKHGKGY